MGIEVGMGRRRPSPAGEVFRRRYGDCKDKSVLLTAMLRAGGVKASPALVSTSHGPVVVTMLPSPTVFDHVIVAVGPPNDPTYWIDPTGKSEGGGLGRYRYSPHGYALTLAEPIEWTRTIACRALGNAADGIRARHLQGPASGEQRPGGPGFGADLPARHGRLLPQAIPDAIHHGAGEAVPIGFSPQRFPHVEQRAPLEHRDDREHNELVVVGHYRVPEFWTWNEAAKHQEVQVTAELIDDFLKYPASKNRRTPLSLEHTFSVHQEAILLIAEGLELVPTSGEEDSEGFLFSYNFLRGADNVHLIWHYASKKAFVPASSFAAHTKSVDNARQWLTRNWSYPVQPQDGVHWAALLGMMAAAAAALFGGWRAFLWSPPRPLELPDDAVPAGVTVGIVLLGLRCVFCAVQNVVGAAGTAMGVVDGRVGGRTGGLGGPSHCGCRGADGGRRLRGLDGGAFAGGCRDVLPEEAVVSRSFRLVRCDWHVLAGCGDDSCAQCHCALMHSERRTHSDWC